MNKKWLLYLGLIGLGVVLNDKIRAIPKIGPMIPTV